MSVAFIISPDALLCGERTTEYQVSRYKGSRTEEVNPKVKHVIICAIFYHLYNFKNVKKSHGRVLLLVKLRVKHFPILSHTLF